MLDDEKKKPEPENEDPKAEEKEKPELNNLIEDTTAEHPPGRGISI